jgi:drug/metabolite transporter (DMT)-like permease
MREIAIERSAASRHWRGVALVAGAAAAWSIAGIITRLTATDAWTTLFWRSLFAAAFLGCYIAFKEQGDWRVVVKRFGWPSLAIAVSFAAAMITFIVALHETTVANVLFIQATAPFFAALGAWLLMREPVFFRTLMAISLALFGVGIMVSDSAVSGRLLGDLLSVALAVCLAATIVVARRYPKLQMAEATCAACLITALVTAPLASPMQVSPNDLMLLAIFGICQMGLGLVMFSAGVQLIPAAEAGLVSVLETVLAPIWVWLAVGEVPGRLALVGGGIVMIAVLGHLVTERIDEHGRRMDRPTSI